MKKTIIRVAISVIAAIIILITFAFILFRIAFPPAPSLADMTKKFERNQSNILKVVAVFREIQSKAMGIDLVNDEGYSIVIYDSLPVERYVYDDDELGNAFKSLSDDGCLQITKEENSIYFQWWAIRDASSGIVYATDGELPKMRSYFPSEAKEEIFVPLGYENWYYHSFQFIR